MADSNQNDDDYISSSTSGMDFSNFSMRTILSDQSIQSYLFKGSRSLGLHSFQGCDDDDDDGDNDDNDNVQMEACGETPKQPRTRRSSICKELSLDLLAVFASARFYGKSGQDVYESAQRNGFTDKRIYECSKMLNIDHDETMDLHPRQVFINLIDEVSLLMNGSILSTDGNTSFDGEIDSVSRESFVNHVALARKKFMEKLEASRAYASKESIPEESMDEANVETDEGDENRPPSPVGVAERIVEPNANDVLLGQSPTLRSHYGNRRLRELVEARYNEYMGAKKLEKTAISESIMQQIKEEGGQFLMKAKTKKEVGKKRSLDDDLWMEAPFEKAREKVTTTFKNITARLKKEAESATESEASEEGL